MERLTERDCKGKAYFPKSYNNPSCLGDAIEKLARYEDLEEKGLLKIKNDRSHCEICGKPTGTKRFCSDACKQAAYRKRKAGN